MFDMACNRLFSFFFLFNVIIQSTHMEDFVMPHTGGEDE